MAIQLHHFILLHYPEYYKIRQDNERKERMDRLDLFIDGCIRSHYNSPDAVVSLYANLPIEKKQRQQDELTLKSGSRQPRSFRISKKSASLSKFLLLVTQEDDEPETVEIDKVGPKTLLYVVEYLNHHGGQEPQSNNEWNMNWINKLNQNTVFKIAFAANYMDIPSLLDLCCNKLVEEIKQYDQERINEIICLEEQYREQTQKQNQDVLLFEETHSDVHKALQKRLDCNKIHQKLIEDIQDLQTSIKDKFKQSVIDGIKKKMFNEIYKRKIDKKYNLIQWSKLLKCLTTNILTQGQIRNILDNLNEDPAHITLFFCQCIRDVDSKAFQFDKTKDNCIFYVEGSNIAYQKLEQETKENQIKKKQAMKSIRPVAKPKQSKEKKMQLPVHHESHNLLTHLLFEFEFKSHETYGVCQHKNCSRRYVGVISNGFFYCSTCFRNYKVLKCKNEMCGETRLGAVDKGDKLFYCFECWRDHQSNNYKQMIGPPVQLPHAHENVSKNKFKGRTKVAETIGKSMRDDLRKNIFIRFYYLHQLKNKKQLKPKELFAILIKYGIGSLFLHSYHSIKELQREHLLDIIGWINAGCNDDEKTSFTFQQISNNWYEDFEIFWLEGLQKTRTEMETWIQKQGQYFNLGHSCDIMGFLSFINNALKHFNSMFNIGKDSKIKPQNEYGVWLILLKYFKGLFRLIVKVEGSLQHYLIKNKKTIESRAPHVVCLLESLKEDLGVLYDLTICCSEDFIGYNLFYYGLKKLNKRDHPPFYEKKKKAKKQHQQKQNNPNSSDDDDFTDNDSKTNKRYNQQNTIPVANQNQSTQTNSTNDNTSNQATQNNNYQAQGAKQNKYDDQRWCNKLFIPEGYKPLYDGNALIWNIKREIFVDSKANDANNSNDTIARLLGLDFSSDDSLLQSFANASGIDAIVLDCFVDHCRIEYEILALVCGFMIRISQKEFENERKCMRYMVNELTPLVARYYSDIFLFAAASRKQRYERSLYLFKVFDQTEARKQLLIDEINHNHPSFEEIKQIIHWFSNQRLMVQTKKVHPLEILYNAGFVSFYSNNKLFKWLQTTHKIVMLVEVPYGLTEKDIYVELEKSYGTQTIKLALRIKGKFRTYLCGQVEHRVKQNECEMKLKKDMLLITLQKEMPFVAWSRYLATENAMHEKDLKRIQQKFDFEKNEKTKGKTGIDYSDCDIYIKK
eukprot:256484_1